MSHFPSAFSFWRRTKAFTHAEMAEVIDQVGDISDYLDAAAEDYISMKLKGPALELGLAQEVIGFSYLCHVIVKYGRRYGVIELKDYLQTRFTAGWPTDTDELVKLVKILVCYVTCILRVRGPEADAVFSIVTKEAATELHAGINHVSASLPPSVSPEPNRVDPGQPSNTPGDATEQPRTTSPRSPRRSKHSSVTSNVSEVAIVTALKQVRDQAIETHNKLISTTPAFQDRFGDISLAGITLAAPYSEFGSLVMVAEFLSSFMEEVGTAKDPLAKYSEILARFRSDFKISASDLILAHSFIIREAWFELGLFSMQFSPSHKGLTGFAQAAYITAHSRVPHSTTFTNLMKGAQVPLRIGASHFTVAPRRSNETHSKPDPKKAKSGNE